MQANRFGFLCGMLVLVAFGSPLGAKPETGPEIKWAKGIADDFWKAFTASNSKQAAGLFSPELSKAVVSYDGFDRVGGDARLIETSPGMYVNGLANKYGPKVTVSFDMEELAPDRSEVIFRGKLSGMNYYEEKVDADFTMRIAKEGTGAKWSIRYLLITDRKEAKDKK
jgi:hypothetical protein